MGRPVRPHRHADVGKVLATAEVKERLAIFGFEPYIGAPGELTKAMERDSRMFSEVVKRAMKLYSFFRSGTSHRLRIALNLKGLSYEQAAVDLPREEHFAEAFKAINPQQFVPVLESDGRLMTQSPAIIEWLEERHPKPPLLRSMPASARWCAHSRLSWAATSTRSTTGASCKRCATASGLTKRR